MKDSLDDLSHKLKEFAVQRDWEQFHTPKNLAMSVVVEAAELVEHFQWLTPSDSFKLDARTRQEVSYEMADILIYLIRLGERLDIDLIKATYEKLAINEKRFKKEEVYGRHDIKAPHEANPAEKKTKANEN